MTRRVITTRHVAEMRALAASGLHRTAIARKTGWHYRTVARHIGDLVPPLPRERQRAYPDYDRYSRMLKAAASAEYGDRDEVAHRFGLKNAKVLDVVLVTARRRVGEERLGKGDRHGA